MDEHGLSVAAATVVAFADEQAHPFVCVDADLVEGLGRVPVTEIPGPSFTAYAWTK